MIYAIVAQLVEQLICNQPVVGSTPIDGSNCGSNSVVECNLAKVDVGGSNPLSRSNRGIAQPGSASALGAEGRRFKSCCPDHFYGAIAQLGERLAGSQKVVGSIPAGSTFNIGSV